MRLSYISLTDTYRTPSGWDASSIYALSKVAILGAVDVAVYSVDGQLLFTVQGRDVDGGTSGNGTTTEGGAEPESGPSASAEPSGATTADDQFDVRSYPIVVEGQKIATAELFTPLDAQTAAEKDYQRALTGDLVVGVVAAAILAFLASLVVSRRVTGPLEELADAAQEVSKGNLDMRVAPHSEDEVGALAVAFNSMAGRLAQDEEWRRDMSADLAHELQAPLATIRSRIQALEDGGSAATPEDLRVIREGVERLGRPLAALRSLSELESEDLDIEFEELDLADIGREAMAQARTLFQARDVDLAADLAPARVNADRDRLDQVVANLLDNALKNTPSGGRVTVSVSSGEGPPDPSLDDREWARLSVVDSGPSIESVDLPFVFDRFYGGVRLGAPTLSASAWPPSAASRRLKGAWWQQRTRRAPESRSPCTCRSPGELRQGRDASSRTARRGGGTTVPPPLLTTVLRHRERDRSGSVSLPSAASRSTRRSPPRGDRSLRACRSSRCRRRRGRASRGR